MLERRRRFLLGAATLLCLITFTGYAHVKAPWMDECLEVSIARLPLPEIWSVLRSGVQVDPPMLHGILHYLFRIFGESFWLARMPAVVGFSMLCLCSALIVWRRSSALYGAAAFFLPYATFARTWGSSVHFLPYYIQSRREAPNSLLYLYDFEKPLEEFDNDAGDLVMARLRGHTEARVESFDAYAASRRRMYLATMGAKGCGSGISTTC